jgi:hypothetical protein
MLIGVHFKNISALNPDTSLPLSQAIFLSLSLFYLSASTALCGINYATAFRRRRCCVLSSSFCTHNLPDKNNFRQPRFINVSLAVRHFLKITRSKTGPYLTA